MEEKHHNQPGTNNAKLEDSKEKTLKWKLLGIFAPPIGIAFYVQMKRERPVASEAVLFGSIIGLTVIFIGLFILGIILGASAA